MAVVCLTPVDLEGQTLELWLADTFADLVGIDVSLSVDSLLSARQALLSGNNSIGDGGGGLFMYNPDSAETPNGFSVSAASNGVGRWVAVQGIRYLGTPLVSTSARTGDYAFSALYSYRCVATNTWRRVAHASF